MAAPRGQAATKNQLIELVVLALGSSQLKDVGLKALRGVLGSDPRFSVLDGAADLQPVWELLEGQPEFQSGAATSAMCWVKGLEGRLGIVIKLPAAIEELSIPERIAQAAQCRPKREEVDRVVEGLEPLRKQSPLASSPPRAIGPLVVSEKRRRIIGTVAAGVALLCVVFVGFVVADNVEGTPKFKPLDTAEFAGDLPVTGASTWGTEVHVSLVDPSWLKQPEDRRRRQMEQALDRLQGRQQSVTTLLVEDDTKRLRASAQMFSRGGRIQVRFY